MIEQLTKIDEALNQCSCIYRSCTNTGKLTTDLEVKIKVSKAQLEHLDNNFDGTRSLTSATDGQILVTKSKISTLEKDMDRLIQQARELRRLVCPRLNTLLLHKQESLELINKPTPVDLTKEELHAYILNGFVSILGTLKSGWDTQYF